MIRIAAAFSAFALAACAASPAAESTPTSERICDPAAARAQLGAISPESARLEPFIYPLIEKVVRLPGYSDHWVEHVPRYTFVVAFTRPPSLAEIQRLAPPEIRDRIAVRTAKRSQEEIGRARDLITERLRAARIGSWSSGYNPVSQCFEIGVESAARIEQVRALLPADVLVDADFRVQGPLRTF